ncbi:MAG: malonyl-ACP O-methyltransferase BioC [Pseudomonadales bacterium]|nr:malonyl-ACP O-methyltransferase BioC [Pseudomonadales bacterium]MBP9034513.1 malonyl-ACP O-methyltransferase BioC [Pseudomonadales bacterium]
MNPGGATLSAASDAPAVGTGARLRVVLLHGWGSRSGVFAAFARALAADFDVLALDLPAHGASAQEAFPRQEAALLAWMRERIPAGAVLIGWSLGGALGLRLAQAFPGHLAALVTIATSPCFLQREDWSAGMDAAAFAAFRAGLLADAQAQLGRFAALQAHRDLRQRELARQLRALAVAPAGTGELLAALDTLAGLDLRAGLAALELPVLHVLGERDAIVTAQVAAHYARLQPRASVWLVPGAAHAPFLSRPAAVLARVTDFLCSRLAAPAAATRSKQDIARSFGRAAAGYERAAQLQRTIGEELLALAPPLAPARVLDLGSGTGHFSARLARRFPRAAVIGLDLAEGMLRQARAGTPGAAARWLCGDAEQLPLAGASIDLVYSSLALQWCESPGPALAGIARVLAPGGQALIATLGDDTLWELRAAWRAVDARVHVNRFESVATLERAARAAGLVVRVIGQKYHLPAYPDAQALARELRALGAHNVNAGRPDGLAGRGAWRRLQSAYAELANPDGTLPATYRALCLWLEKPRG